MADGKVSISTELDNSGIDRDLKDVKKKAQQAGDAVEDFGDEFTDAGKKSRRAAGDIEDDFDGLKTSADSLGKSLAGAFAVDKIIDFGANLLQTTEELRGDLSLLDANARNAGIGLDVTREAMQKLNTVSGEADSSVEAVSNLLAAGIPENRMQEAVDGLANAVIMFPDTLKIESLADSIQETLATGTATGQFGELLDRLGIGAENFTKNMSGALTELERQNMVLDALNNGALKGVYEGWAQANPELVAGRDATFELQTALTNLGSAIAPIATQITEISADFINFAFGVENAGTAIKILISAVLGIAVAGAIPKMIAMVEALLEMDNAARLAKVSSIGAAAGFASLFYLILEAADVWSAMSDFQKVVTVLGLLTVAALSAALAVGAFHSAWSVGIAAAAIVAGIVAVKAAIGDAQREIDKFEQINSLPTLADTRGIPQLASGAVIPPNGQFLAVLGDQRHGRNLEAPEGLIRQIVREESGGGGGTLRISPGPGFTRYLKYELEQENVRAGKPLVGGTRR